MERGEIHGYLKMDLSLREIARRTGRNVSTISREKRRGTVTQLDTHRKPFKKYFPDVGARVYKENRQNCGTPTVFMKSWEFILYAEKKLLEDKWAPDSIVGHAKKTNSVKGSYIPSTKTLYNWIDAGMLSVRNIDLAMKLRRSTKKKRLRRPKRTFGQSIEERCESIESREEFGHWEIDTVIGQKSKDEALLTLIERKTRKELMMRIPSKTASSVHDGLKRLFSPFENRLSDVFKSITADNGSEFSELGQLHENKGISVYFSHPYASYERGTNERHNGMIRRFIKKGQPIHEYTDQKLQEVEAWMNEMPRKILEYDTPNEQFARCVELV
ncbi:IS30 family transposase, partial [Rossellomorea vietnamensis]|uniref:IS30 family transposase n=1 Tax=Rossellomorea vietnamensis TaxID=218284 RepID=UPI003CF918EA